MKTIGIITACINDKQGKDSLSKDRRLNSIERAIKKFNEFSIFDDIIIFSDNNFSSYINQVSDRWQCKVYIPEKNESAFLKSALSQFNCSDSTVIHLCKEAVFLSRGLLEQLLRLHKFHKADYSVFKGLPEGLSPEILSPKAIEKISSNRLIDRGDLLKQINIKINKVPTGFHLEELSLSEKYIFLENTEDLPKFFKGVHAQLKSLLRDSLDLHQVKYFNQQLNILEKGLQRKHMDSYPVRARVELHSGCNLKCTTCFQQFPRLGSNDYFEKFGFLDNQRGPFNSEEDGSYRIRPHSMSASLFHKIEKPLFPYLKEISFGINGEVTLNPNLVFYLKTAKRYHLTTSLITNGVLLDDFLSRQFANGLLDGLTLSIDGGTKETFEKIRRGASFEKVLNNIEHLQKIKEEFRSRAPHIVFSVTLSRENIKELPMIIELANEYNVKTIQACYTNFFKFMDQKDALVNYPELVSEIFEQSKELAQKYHITLNLPIPISENLVQEDVFCSIPWEETFIFQSGQVKPCCFMKFRGNINENNFFKIWNNDHFKKVRETFCQTGERLENCRNCIGGMHRKKVNRKFFFFTEENFPF